MKLVAGLGLELELGLGLGLGLGIRFISKKAQKNIVLHGCCMGDITYCMVAIIDVVALSLTDSSFWLFQNFIRIF